MGEREWTGLGKVRESGFELATAKAQWHVSLTTLFCVLIFNLIDSLLMVLNNEKLRAVVVIKSTPHT